MSASLARSVFRPTPTVVRSRIACPVSRFLPTGAGAPTRSSSVSTRTINIVAHLTVGAALAASAFTVLSHPDSLFFDHPPRSAISWTPEKHLANRELHSRAVATVRSSPRPSGPPSGLSPGSPAPSIGSPSIAHPAAVAAEYAVGADWHWELRLAGVLGRTLAGQ